MHGIKWRKLVIYDSLPSRGRESLTFAARRGEFRLRSKTKATVGVPTIRRHRVPRNAPSRLRILSLHAPSLSSSRERVTTGNEGGGMFNARQKETDVSRVSIRETRASNVKRLEYLSSFSSNEKPRNRVRAGWKNVNEGVYN